VDARGLLDGLLDLFLPRRCVACREPGAWLCAECAAQLEELPERRCRRCGAPVPPAAVHDPPTLRGPGGVARCPECEGRELAFSSAAAAFVYAGPARALVTACKFRAFRSIASEMTALAAPAFVAACGGAAAAAAATAEPAAAGLVTWVPGHRERSLERGFNQAELLGRGLARAAGLPAAPLLLRTRHGARQSGLDRIARATNVEDTFALRQDASRVLTNLKRVVIVDDVYTTGETLNHCARVIEQTGIDPFVFTFARTTRAVRAHSRVFTATSPATTASSRASLHTATPKERCR
jgi:ComF family protein